MFDLLEKKEYSLKEVKRAILRYALRCPGDRARAIVAEMRRENAEYVEDNETLLQLDDPVERPKSN